MESESFVTVGDGARIHFLLQGDRNKPVLMLFNSIGTDMHMWDAEVQPLLEHFQVLRYDTRGHGLSDVPEGFYSMDRLGRDAIEMLDELHVDRVHFCGLSLGGMIGQWLGAHAPERLRRLILSNTAAFLGPAKRFDEHIRALLEAGTMKEEAEEFLRGWFPASMLDSRHPAVERFRRTLNETSYRGIAGCLAAVRAMDMRRVLGVIPVPTLLIAGEWDIVTTAADGRLLAELIPGAELRLFPAVHLTNVELTIEFLKTVTDFLLGDGATHSTY